jgi:hypothetical protein
MRKAGKRSLNMHKFEDFTEQFEDFREHFICSQDALWF